VPLISQAADHLTKAAAHESSTGPAAT